MLLILSNGKLHKDYNTKAEVFMLSLGEIQQIQLEELEYIDSLCRKNDLEYSLTYGTLIGAVRHGGFIPWDDDIDIMLRRNDYEKLLLIIKDDGKYKLISREDSCFNWAKIVDTRTYVEEDDKYNIKDYGVWVDIFPLDEVPDPFSLKGHLHMFFVKVTNSLAQKRAIDKSHAKCWKGIYRWVWLVRHSVLSVFSIKFYSDHTYKTLTKYHGCNTGFVGEGNYYWRSPKRSFKKKMFDSYMDIQFEYITSRTIKDYDLFLTNTYGDYMKLPPIEQQKSVHHYRAYWK